MFSSKLYRKWLGRLRSRHRRNGTSSISRPRGVGSHERLLRADAPETDEPVVRVPLAAGAGRPPLERVRLLVRARRGRGPGGPVRRGVQGARPVLGRAEEPRGDLPRRAGRHLAGVPVAVDE